MIIPKTKVVYGVVYLECFYRQHCIWCGCYRGWSTHCITSEVTSKHGRLDLPDNRQNHSFSVTSTSHIATENYMYYIICQTFFFEISRLPSISLSFKLTKDRLSIFSSIHVVLFCLLCLEFMLSVI